MLVVHGYKGDARILERVVVTETREAQGKYIYRRRPIVVVGDSIPPQPQAYCALKVAAHLLAHSAQVTLILSAKLLPQKHLCGGPVLDTFPMAPKVYLFRGGSDPLFLEAELLILEVV